MSGASSNSGTLSHFPPREQRNNTRSGWGFSEKEGVAVVETVVRCPDPQCGALLDMQTALRLYLDQKGNQVYPSATYGARFIFEAIGLCFLIWIVTGIALEILFHGDVESSPVASWVGAVGFLAGIAVCIAGQWLASRSQKMALWRATSIESCRCSRCGRWWMIPSAALLQPSSAHPLPD
jgi:hypothetical protein